MIDALSASSRPHCVAGVSSGSRGQGGMVRTGSSVRTGLKDRPADIEPWPDSQSERMICVCVGEFGLNADVNRAALRLAAMERLHAIGCRVSGETWAAWGRLLRGLDNHGVDIGLTLDLSESALLPRSRRPLSRLIAASLTGRLDRRALRAELRAQLDSFEQVIGHAPAFIDGHQSVHELPGVRGEWLDEIERRYGAFRPWLRSSGSASGARRAVSCSWTANTLRSIVEAMSSRGLASVAARRGFLLNRSSTLMHAPRAGVAQHREAWGERLRACADGDLLICRPEMGDRLDGPLAEEGYTEYQWLGSPEFGELLEFSGVSLWPMSQILMYHGAPT